MRCEANGKTELTIAARIDETHQSASRLPTGAAAAAVSHAEADALPPPALTMHSPDGGPNSEHASEYPGPLTPLVLLLLHDFPDPGRSHRFLCSSPPSDT